MDEIKRISRVCNNAMTIDDYIHFFIQLYEVPTRETSLIIHLNILEADATRYFANIPDLAQYEDIILSSLSSTGKVVLFLILPSLSTIEAFCPTPVSYEDVKETLKNLLTVLTRSFGKPFSIRLRLQVPQNFHRDPLFTALFLVGIIDQQGKYFLATEATILKYKLYMIRDFIHIHDSVLGKLDYGKMTKSSHPFRKPRRKCDQFDRIENKGWHVMDVDGDGNCGYYALLLALQNVGIREYYINTQDVSPRIAKGRWQQIVISLRQRLKEGSEELLSTIFPKNSPNRKLEWWMNVIGTFSVEDQTELSSSFLIPRNNNPSIYFEKKFTDDESLHHYQMNPYWSAVVIAHVFKARVVIITRSSSPKENASTEGDVECDVEYTHSTKIFEFDDDFEANKDKYNPVKEYPNCYRVSDVSFIKKPTIELLFTTGFKSLDGEPDDNHFLFLRRVLCVKVHPSLPISEVALRNFIIAQQENENDAMEVDVESPQEATKGIPADNVQGDSVEKMTVATVENNEIQTVGRRIESIVDREKPLHEAEEVTSPMAIDHETPNDAVEKVAMSTAESNEIQTVGRTIESTVDQKEHLDQAEEVTSPMVIDNEKPKESSLVSTSNASQKKDHPSSTSNPVTENEEMDDLYDNIMYDDKTQRFFTGRFDSDKRRYLEKTVIEDTSTIDDQLLEDAKSQPNTWVSLPLGDPGDDPPPDYLTTKVKCLYEQLEKPYCVTYCLASALFYCGFDHEARRLATQASLLAPCNMSCQIEIIQSFLPNLVPLIGGCTIYGKRCAGNNKRKRPITWKDLFTDLTPYPTLVVPVKKLNGKMTHAFCVVDDLIFDSSASHALKLKEESVSWIFRNEPVDIFVAIRFNQKVSPKGKKVRGIYNRHVQINWNPASEQDEQTNSHDRTSFMTRSLENRHVQLVVSKVYDVEFSGRHNLTKIDIVS